jgi:prohibitin 2
MLELISIVVILGVLIAFYVLLQTGDLRLSHVGIGLVIILIAVAANGAIYTVDAGQRAVLLTFGAPDDAAVGPGLHTKIPLMQTVELFDVKTQKYEADASAASKDLQNVHSKVAVIYHLRPESVPRLYAELGQGYGDRVIQPMVQEVLKSCTAKFSADQLITNRTSVASMIQDSLYDRLSPYGIVVESIAITNFDFSEAFTQAIEAKVTAAQQKQKADMDLQRIEVEARQKVASARAEAESLNLQKQAVTPELIELRKIEMQTRAVEKWNGQLPAYVGDAMPFLNLKG